MAAKRGLRGPRGRRFWRISSETKTNIDLAIKARQWGMRRKIGVQALRPGDCVAFYVSRGRFAGYWGTATVTSGLFLSKTRVWQDDLYPVRFTLAPQRTVRDVGVPREAVMAKLGRRRLTYLRQAGVIRLTAEEFNTIAELLTAPAG